VKRKKVGRPPQEKKKRGLMPLLKKSKTVFARTSKQHARSHLGRMKSASRCPKREIIRLKTVGYVKKKEGDTRKRTDGKPSKEREQPKKLRKANGYV